MPAIRGPVEVSYDSPAGGVFNLRVRIPGNMIAAVSLSASEVGVLLDGNPVYFLAAYARAWCHLLQGEDAKARRLLSGMKAGGDDGAFAGRLAEEPMLRAIMAASPKDSRAPYLLGNLLYHWGRVDEAMVCWKTAVARDRRRTGALRNMAKALAGGDLKGARAHLEADLNPPESLGEVRHLLANASDLWWLLGLTESALGNAADARMWWRKAADFSGDFQVMAPTPVSEMTHYRIRCLRLLGRKPDARAQQVLLRSFIRGLREQPGKIDYFATSLPTLLLFHENVDKSQKQRAEFLACQALLLEGKAGEARRRLRALQRVNPDHLLIQQALRESSTV